MVYFVMTQSILQYGITGCVDQVIVENNKLLTAQNIV